VPLQQDAIDLDDLLARAARRFAARFEEQGLDFAIQTDGVVRVRGDALRLERIIENLLDNALKYTPSGGRVAVSLTGGFEAVLTVSNSGVSIPPDELERVFERFYRLDRARSSRARGSGLGLAIARELAELHGGTLTAASTAQGVSFTLRLPLEGPAEPRATANAVRVGVPSTTG
jgi:signal transduction histidine kinase